jgi:hypothetical protein
LEVPAKVESVCRMIEVRKDLRLRRVPLGPNPVLLQLFGERIGIIDAFDIATGARVLVPVPGTADIGATVETAYPETLLVAKAMYRVQAGESGSYDNHIEICTSGAGSHGKLSPFSCDACHYQVIFRSASHRPNGGTLSAMDIHLICTASH